jgi:ABC-2 type transport system ATP-binding protein
MIKIENLRKSYGPIEALRGVQFAVQEGEIVGLLGPNGAGKSSTIKILTGYMHPDAGKVEVDGLDVLTHTRDVQARIGYLSENTPLYPTQSVQNYLQLMADLRGVSPDLQAQYISDAIRATGLADYRTRRISQLSKGLRQRVGLAQAILHKPRLLILDEPTVGLDPTQIVEIRGLIRRLSKHSTILFSSHILSEVEALCDRVVIIINGEVKADARLADLEATNNTILVLQQAAANGAALEGTLTALPSVQGVEPLTTRDGYPAYKIISKTDIAYQVFEAARSAGWPVRELRRETLTLESIFNQLATAS